MSAKRSTIDPGNYYQAGNDPVLEWMKQSGEELSVARWLELSYPEGTPEMTAELMASIPPELSANHGDVTSTARAQQSTSTGDPPTYSEADLDMIDKLGL